MLTFTTFVGFTLFVAFLSWFKLRKDNIGTRDGYFLGGRSLPGIIIAGSMIMTTISTEHLSGLNRYAYKHGMIIIALEVTSAIALVIAALYFLHTYLRMGLTTVREYIHNSFDNLT